MKSPYHRLGRAVNPKIEHVKMKKIGPRTRESERGPNTSRRVGVGLDALPTTAWLHLFSFGPSFCRGLSCLTSSRLELLRPEEQTAWLVKKALVPVQAPFLVRTPPW